jgi:hypothetical protein
MAESPLFNHEVGPPVQCPRCGRLFERPLRLETATGHVDIRGHVQGDPVACVPLPGMASIRGSGRDARERRAGRRG